MPLNSLPSKAQISVWRACRGLSQQISGLNLNSLTLSKSGTVLLKSLPRMGGYTKDCPWSSGATVLQRASQSHPEDQTHCCWGKQTWKLKLRHSLWNNVPACYQTCPGRALCVKQLQVTCRAGLPTWNVSCADYPSTRSRQMLWLQWPPSACCSRSSHEEAFMQVASQLSATNKRHKFG